MRRGAQGRDPQGLACLGVGRLSSGGRGGGGTAASLGDGGGV
jgi:hypothetical protein